MKIGLIVNPIAGIGGPLAKKGSDHLSFDLVTAEPHSMLRAADALATIDSSCEVVTCIGVMGSSALPQNQRVDLLPVPKRTTSEDTKKAAQIMLEKEVDLLVFSGGDGTARDIYDAIGDRIPVLGVPSGVKIQSAVFAQSPKSAASIIEQFIQGDVQLIEREVLDLDELALADGIVQGRLYGTLKVPKIPSLLQGGKQRTSENSITRELINGMYEEMDYGLYLLGPGSTMLGLKNRLQKGGTLIGFDLYENGSLVKKDLNEEGIYRLPLTKLRVILTVIGGQGYLFGRGNQQLSPRVIRQVPKENIIIFCSEDKLIALSGKPFLSDTGDADLDQKLEGFIKVFTGYNKRTIYKLVAVN